jgi:GNAT superfamily N-acetyltransferase
MTYVLRRATKRDQDRIVALVFEASTWLRGRGSDQWQGPIEPRRRRIERDIAAGTAYVVETGRLVVASITVDDFADPELWLPEDRPDDALYVHRMVVARSHAGREIGLSMLDWAGRRAVAEGKHLLRLDAWATNRDLHTYYVKRGFFKVISGRTLANRGSGANFERFAESYCGRGPELVEAALSQPEGRFKVLLASVIRRGDLRHLVPARFASR